MKCPACGSSNMIEGARDVPYTDKEGKGAMLLAVEGQHCLDCEESVYTTEQANAFLMEIKDL